MNRIASGLCIAAAFSFAASLGAQTTTSSANSTMSHDKDIVVTGCLQRGADGNYMLTNAKMDESARPGTSTTTGTTGTSGTSTTAGTSTTGSAEGSSAAMASTWTLEGGTDLDKHVGHKIQVTGREADSSHSMGSSTGTSSTGTSTGTTATTGTTGTSGSEASSQRSTSAHSGPKLDVSSVKMISSSCS